jgi:2-amino-4-hydroxy-6-hydroxymethyldihydropteridine diphosphokinase
VAVPKSGGASAREQWDASIIVALGGNLAGTGRDVSAVIEAALQALPVLGVRVAARSRLWRSAAWPDPSDPQFLNAVARVETSRCPEALLDALHEVEAGFGRTRGAPNAPRSIDLDLIAYGRERRDGRLVLPHPRAAERLFVMGPLAEIAPDWRHPTDGRTARELAQLAPIGRDATPLEP